MTDAMMSCGLWPCVEIPWTPYRTESEIVAPHAMRFCLDKGFDGKQPSRPAGSPPDTLNRDFYGGPKPDRLTMHVPSVRPDEHPANDSDPARRRRHFITCAIASCRVDRLLSRGASRIWWTAGAAAVSANVPADTWLNFLGKPSYRSAAIDEVHSSCSQSQDLGHRSSGFHITVERGYRGVECRGLTLDACRATQMSSSGSVPPRSSRQTVTSATQLRRR
jgi:hypothetical protein